VLENKLLKQREKDLIESDIKKCAICITFAAKEHLRAPEKRLLRQREKKIGTREKDLKTI
jgi:hypothetical protein